jgi:hypothetical protein
VCLRVFIVPFTCLCVMITCMYDIYNRPQSPDMGGAGDDDDGAAGAHDVSDEKSAMLLLGAVCVL